MWRSGTGHERLYLAKLTEFSLVARVCGQDISLETSGNQASLADNVRSYLNPDAQGIEQFFNGQVLCLVALVCWYLMLSKEVQDALDLFRAIMHLPRERTTRIVAFEHKNLATTYRLECVACSLAIFMLAALVYRLTIAALLLYCGTYFLVHTIHLADLILNAVALDVFPPMDSWDRSGPDRGLFGIL